MITIQSKFSNLLILTGISLLSGLIFSLVAILVVGAIYNVPFGEVSQVLRDLKSADNLPKAKIILFFNSFGLFVVPSIIFALIFRKNSPNYFKFKNNSALQQLPILIFLFFISMPIINLSSELNSNLTLPSFLSELEVWMKAAEVSAMEMTRALLRMDSLNDLAINILLIGVLPAIGEELIFRGVIQQVLTKGSKNYHFGIWLTAIIFSAIHFQFYGFLPRVLLGAYFGYLFYWSKNIWLPIFAHFLNNTMAVLAAYYLGTNGLEKELEKVGTTNETIWFSLISVGLFAAIFVYLKRKLTANQ